jgi:SET domain-containing protein
MSKNKKLPHEGLHARIGRSKIHGVGVIAIVPIAKGTDLFPTDHDELTWVDETDLPDAPALRRFYDDFCIRKGSAYGCPRSFNELTAAWYLNHSDSPNVKCDANYRFFALRDIKEGEELTVDYSTYSENSFLQTERRANDAPQAKNRISAAGG